MIKIDLNCDLGEGGVFACLPAGRQRLLDKKLMRYVTSANIACGLHSGSPVIMRQTVQVAKEQNVAIGAHPGFPDSEGFGRRNISLTPEEIRDSIIYQIGALESIARAEGQKLRHLKVHGMLYHLALEYEEIARAVVDAVRLTNDALWIFTMPDSLMTRLCEQSGLRYAAEAFADRAYQPDGRLVPRDQPGALITSPDEVCTRIVTLLQQGTITAIDGHEIKIGRIDTVCLHSDTPDALEIAQKLTAKLTEEGIKITSLTG